MLRIESRDEREQRIIWQRNALAGLALALATVLLSGATYISGLMQ